MNGKGNDRNQIKQLKNFDVLAEFLSIVFRDCTSERKREIKVE